MSVFFLYISQTALTKEKRNGLDEGKEHRIRQEGITKTAELTAQVILSPLAVLPPIIHRPESEQAELIPRHKTSSRRITICCA